MNFNFRLMPILLMLSLPTMAHQVSPPGPLKIKNLTNYTLDDSKENTVFSNDCKKDVNMYTEQTLFDALFAIIFQEGKYFDLNKIKKIGSIEDRTEDTVFIKPFTCENSIGTVTVEFNKIKPDNDDLVSIQQIKLQMSWDHPNHLMSYLKSKFGSKLERDTFSIPLSRYGVWIKDKNSHQYTGRISVLLDDDDTQIDHINFSLD